MLAEAVRNVTLYDLLLDIDERLAGQVRVRGCSCGGTLHAGHYERRPRGGPFGLGRRHRQRFSFCCSEEGCRRRVLPPSCRFDGRRVYWRCIMLVVVALRGSRRETLERISELLELSYRTVERWMVYYRDVYPAGGEWKRLRGFVSGMVRSRDAIGELASHFVERTGDAVSGMAACIEVLVTGRSSLIDRENRGLE